jgi:hypothetical protein
MRRAHWLGNASVRIPLDSTRVDYCIATRPGAAVVDSETAQFEEDEHSRSTPIPVLLRREVVVIQAQRADRDW